jgi:hypothetical protein
MNVFKVIQTQMKKLDFLVIRLLYGNHFLNLPRTFMRLEWTKLKALKFLNLSMMNMTSQKVSKNTFLKSESKLLFYQIKTLILS